MRNRQIPISKILSILLFKRYQTRKKREWKKNVLICQCAVENGKSSQKGAKQILCILKRSSKELGARLFWPNCAQNRPFTQWSKIKNSISKLLVENQEFFCSLPWSHEQEHFSFNNVCFKKTVTLLVKCVSVTVFLKQTLVVYSLLLATL